MPASGKTKFIAEASIERFFFKHRVVYVWTFTSRDVVSKAVAEARFKPFKDLIARKGKEMLFVWELQARGAWHVHLVTDAFLDVNKLREFMVDRGWGPQMRVDRIQSSEPLFVEGHGWIWVGNDKNRVEKTVRYLCKYLTKGFRGYREGDAVPDEILLWARRELEAGNEREVTEEFEKVCRECGSDGALEAQFNLILRGFWGKKKVFGGSDSAKVGNTRFAFNPWITGKAGSMLCQIGRARWLAKFGSMCVGGSWASHIRVWIRMGYEICDWATFDPFYAPP